MFTDLRPLLFVLQEAYLRWRDVDPSGVAHPRAYLVQVVTRQALNQLRTVRRRREDHVGAWLPEPIRTSPDVADDVELADSVSFAMMLVLETLAPQERAVFVVREVFGYGHREIAALLDRSEAAVRQIAHRARDHVRTGRPRFRPDPATADRVVREFLRATHTGDVPALLALLAPDVVQIADGGGAVAVARSPVHGRDRVARLLAGVTGTRVAPVTVERTQHNGLPSVLLRSASGALEYLLVLDVGDDALVHGIYVVADPAKLASAIGVRPLTRKDSPS